MSAAKPSMARSNIQPRLAVLASTRPLAELGTSSLPRRIGRAQLAAPTCSFRSATSPGPTSIRRFCFIPITTLRTITICFLINHTRSTYQPHKNIVHDIAVCAQHIQHDRRNLNFIYFNIRLQYVGCFLWPFLCRCNRDF